MPPRPSAPPPQQAVWKQFNFGSVVTCSGRWGLHLHRSLLRRATTGENEKPGPSGRRPDEYSELLELQARRHFVPSPRLVSSN
eukprot:756044-Hanusia_phi.AAC.6